MVGEGGGVLPPPPPLPCTQTALRTVPEFIDSVFETTSPKRSFSLIGNERFGLVFAKTRYSIYSGTEKFRNQHPSGTV
jgi:hypothetical protein